MPLTTNQLLKYNGTKWTNSNLTITELTDILFTSPTNNQVLKYNGTYWINIGNILTWDANSNTPTIVSGVGTKGYIYRVTISGSTLVDGNNLWRVGDFIFYNGSVWDRIAISSGPENTYYPNQFYNNYNYEAMKRAIEDLSYSNSNSPVIVKGYTVSLQSSKQGAFNHTAKDLVIFVPTNTNLVFVDPSTLTITSSNTGPVSFYGGAAYHPILKRYYLSPQGQSTNATWHYYDNDANFVGYTHGASVTGQAYTDAVWAPTLNRLYFIPRNQATQTNWHYVDASGTVVAYPSGFVLSSNAYEGGAYSPTLNRIYFVPRNYANQPQWHYIDCSTGSVVAYTHGATVVSGGYLGGCFSPTQNRIYFVPLVQALQSQWHYIDCSTGNVVAYTHGVTGLVANPYAGCVYSPTQNRIYFTPYQQGTQSIWHYIDCNTTGSPVVVSYTHGVTAVAAAYIGGAYNPITDRVFFAPSSQSSQTTWHYIECGTGVRAPNYITDILDNY